MNKTKRLSKRNKLYWINLGYSEENAILESRNRTPGTLEYFINFKKLTPDLAKLELEKYHSSKKLTRENMLSKYGDVEGLRRWDLYRERQAYSNTLEYMINKYGTERGTEKYYTANKNRAVTRENLINKHGEEKGLEIWNGYVEKQRTAGISEEYFINKLGKEEGKKFFIELNKQKSNTYSSYLSRHNGNVEIATEEFNKYMKKRWDSDIKKRGVSANSQELFQSLAKELNSVGLLDYYFANFNQEWGVNIIGKRFVYLDFFLKSKGKAIEFNGDYYHANPDMYPDDSIIKIYGDARTAKSIREADKNRLDDVRTIPYIKDVMVVWERDWNRDKTKTIQQCMNFLLQ